jgi:hypothetical protein
MRAAWLVLLCLPGLAGARHAPKTKPAPPPASPWHFRLQAAAAAAVPLSPRGPESFAVSYASAAGAGGGLYALRGDWGLGVEGTWARWPHLLLDHTSFSLAAGALVLERVFRLDDDTENFGGEGLVLRLGAGWGQGSLESAYPGGQSWGAPAGLLAAGYRLPWGRHASLELLARSWSLMGDEKRDTVAQGELALQAGWLW